MLWHCWHGVRKVIQYGKHTTPYLQRFLQTAFTEQPFNLGISKNSRNTCFADRQKMFVLYRVWSFQSVCRGYWGKLYSPKVLGSCRRWPLRWFNTAMTRQWTYTWTWPCNRRATNMNFCITKSTVTSVITSLVHKCIKLKGKVKKESSSQDTVDHRAAVIFVALAFS